VDRGKIGILDQKGPYWGRNIEKYSQKQKKNFRTTAFKVITASIIRRYRPLTSESGSALLNSRSITNFHICSFPWLSDLCYYAFTPFVPRWAPLTLLAWCLLMRVIQTASSDQIVCYVHRDRERIVGRDHEWPLSRHDASHWASWSWQS
jgi:hypothetical protein